VHRDVSPHNVMVGVDGTSRLTDFGVAKAEDRLTHTRDGQVKGKLAYMAPEQASQGTCDARSDLFAMGIILWECITGRRMFRAESTAATLNKLLHDEIAPPSAVDPALAPLDGLLRRALARDPAERFQSAEQMIEGIEEMASSVGGVAPRRAVAKAVERYASEKLERDRRVVEGARQALKTGSPLSDTSPDAGGAGEGTSPSRSAARAHRNDTRARHRAAAVHAHTHAQSAAGAQPREAHHDARDGARHDSRTGRRRTATAAAATGRRGVPPSRALAVGAASHARRSAGGGAGAWKPAVGGRPVCARSAGGWLARAAARSACAARARAHDSD
jgi:serine/threonine-protein kinase